MSEILLQELQNEDANQILTSEENAGKPQTITSEENAGIPQTITSEENAGKPQTITSEESAGKPQTITSEESAGKPQTITSEENAGIPQTSPSNSQQVSESLTNFVISPHVNEMFEWIETKIELLKVLQGNDESENNTIDKTDKCTLKEIMKDIHKITSKESTEPADCLSEEVIKMIDMLQDTTRGLLDNLNPSEKTCRSIKVLATLILHLSASVGTKVTIEDIDKHINGKRVMDLYSEVQNSREALIIKIVNARNYIHHGIKKTRNIKKKCKRHGYEINGLFSEYSTSTDVQRVNDKLKASAKESELLLKKYSDSIGYLATKTKNFFSLKQDSERVLSAFMTKEIPNLYKTKV